MAIDKAKDYLRLVLASGIDNVTTTINLVDGADAPDPAIFGEYSLVIYKADDKSAMDYPSREQVRVIAKPSTHVLTVTRGYGGTVANYHNEAGKEYYLEQAFTASHLEQIRTDVSSGLSSQNWASPRAGLILDGVDDFTTTPSDANLSFPDKVFTIETYFTFQGHNGWGGLIRKTFEYAIDISDAGRLVLRLGGNGIGNNILNYFFPSALIIGKKYYILLSVNNTTLNMYIDNVLFYTTTLATDNLFVGNNPMQFNNVSASTFTKFTHYGTRFFNCILTESERLHYWNQGKPFEAPILPWHRGGRQNLYVSNFASGTDGWSKVDGGGGVSTFANTTNKITFATTTIANSNWFPEISKNLALKSNYKYNVRIKYNIISGTPIISRYNAGSSFPLLNIELAGKNEVSFDFQTTLQSLFMYFDGRTLWSLDILSIEVKQLGCTYEVLGENMGRLGIIDTSGNGNHGNTSGSPVSLTAEQRAKDYKDIRPGIVTNTTLTNVVLNGYKSTDVMLHNRSNNPVTINIGTTSGGNQLTPTPVLVPANNVAIITVNDLFSLVNSTTLFIHSANWNSAIIDFYTYQEKRGE